MPKGGNKGGNKHGGNKGKAKQQKPKPKTTPKPHDAATSAEKPVETPAPATTPTATTTVVPQEAVATTTTSTTTATTTETTTPGNDTTNQTAAPVVPEPTPIPTTEPASGETSQVTTEASSTTTSPKNSGGKPNQPKQKGKKKGAAAPSQADNTASAVASVHSPNEPIVVAPVKAKEYLPDTMHDKLLSSCGKNASGETVSTSTAKYDFWKTQPVPGLGAKISADFNHPIEADSRPEDVPKTPVTLPPGYHFCVEEVNDDANIKEIYLLLNGNYVEDEDCMFRFDYSVEFLRWALTPPGYFKDWHVGIRDDTNNVLYGFITGIPATIRVYDRIVRLAEINFLCVHKSLRTQRLAPILIQEVTRRVHLQGMFQAVYTAGVVLPNPVASCSYWHRSLNPSKLVDVGFSGLGTRMTMSRLLKLNKLPDHTSTPGLREMRREDVPAVGIMLAKYLSKFGLTPLFSEEDIAHWFVPRTRVVNSYVVQGKSGLTGFASFYTLPSSVLGHPRHSTLMAAYSFYNVNTSGPLSNLVSDALILAKKAGFDVFNCLDVMENETFLKELKFGIGDGRLQYYLFNWACRGMQPKDIGLVLL
ncbi:glycylpeptide N-tetradecanoyltransferase 2 [Pelomyxa schiedti]|nr:glycylpeptide N-tetradecanoyltransferase 2 [Pelomyxa schiedti]